MDLDHFMSKISLITLAGCMMLCYVWENSTSPYKVLTFSGLLHTF